MTAVASTFIVAEAGVNHNGNLHRAMDMVICAVKSGADAVKFQTFRSESLVTRTAAKANYQQKTTGVTGSQLDMLRQLELSESDHYALRDVCNNAGIQFLSTPFDLESIHFLAKLGQTVWKIPSGEITNLPYLRAIGALRQDVILSTGMSDLDDIGSALAVLENAGTPRSSITLLQCNTAYPTPVEDVNLRVMTMMADRFHGVRVGLSDHTEGIAVAIAATALGAAVIEKHFTLDKTLPGPDHAASLVPDELRNMIRAIRTVEKALGSDVKCPTKSESVNQAAARKYLVTKHAIAQGERFSEANLTAKRTGVCGISPLEWDRIIGARALRDHVADEPLDGGSL